MLIEQPAAVLTGPTATLLDLVLRSPRVKVVVEQLPPWLRPHKAEIVAELRALRHVAAGWAPEPVGVTAGAFERCDETAEDPAVAPFDGVDVVEAARLLRRSRRHVQNLAATGRLPARRVSGRTWLLDRKAVEVHARKDSAA
jgi:excisionase family DNA binding protein